jgi:hypothetical protein
LRNNLLNNGRNNGYGCISKSVDGQFVGDGLAG